MLPDKLQWRSWDYFPLLVALPQQLCRDFSQQHTVSFVAADRVMGRKQRNRNCSECDNDRSLASALLQSEFSLQVIF
jgi:hypothetical protein